MVVNLPNVKKYLDENGLAHFWDNAKAYVDGTANELSAKTSQNIIAITSDMVVKLGDIPRTFNGMTYGVQGIEYANGYLYVGYSRQSTYCCIAKINPSTLEVIAYKEPDVYVHFNSLCYFDGYLYTVSPETSTIDGATACYITVIDASTLEIVKNVSIGADAFMNNLCVAPYGNNSVPFMQAYIRRNGFVNYMSYANVDGEMVTQSVNRCNYTPNAATIADVCCLTNLTGGNAGSVFAHVLSKLESEQALNGIIFTDMSGTPLAYAQLPYSYSSEFEGITVYGSNNSFLMCDNNGALYAVTFDNLFAMVARNGQTYDNELYLPNAATGITNNLKVGFVTSSTNIIRRFCLPGAGIKISLSDLANIFGVSQSNFMAKATTNLDAITVTGIRFYSNSAAALVCCTYSYDSTLTNQRVFNLTKIRAQSILGSNTSVSLDNVDALTDAELATALSGSVFLAARCSLQLENSPREYDDLLWFKGLF